MENKTRVLWQIDQSEAVKQARHPSVGAESVGRRANSSLYIICELLLLLCLCFASIRNGSLRRATISSNSNNSRPFPATDGVFPRVVCWLCRESCRLPSVPGTGAQRSRRSFVSFHARQNPIPHDFVPLLVGERTPTKRSINDSDGGRAFFPLHFFLSQPRSSHAAVPFENCGSSSNIIILLVV